MNRERIKTILYWVLPIIGGAFCVWYITKATTMWCTPIIYGW